MRSTTRDRKRDTRPNFPHVSVMCAFKRFPDLEVLHSPNSHSAMSGYHMDAQARKSMRLNTMKKYLINYLALTAVVLLSACGTIRRSDISDAGSSIEPTSSVAELHNTYMTIACGTLTCTAGNFIDATIELNFPDKLHTLGGAAGLWMVCGLIGRHVACTKNNQYYVKHKRKRI